MKYLRHVYYYDLRMVVRPTKMTHSLKGIEKGRRIEGLERNEVILRAISQNPGINHNSLKKLICVELDAMAIVTFERYLHRLIEQSATARCVGAAGCRHREVCRV